MNDSESHDTPITDNADWELPDTSHVPPVRSFSLRRVLTTVTVAMLAVIPTLYALVSNGYLDKTTNCTNAKQGSGHRGDHGFDLSNSVIPRKEIRGGGPPKDGIPALTNPKLIAASEADYLQPTDRIIGVATGGEARAYPLAILNYHEIVNDRIGDQAFAVSYCPLCDSASVFDRSTPDGDREFGVSGLLYNSNVLMYDRDSESESLWSQLRSKSIAGPKVDQQLRLFPLELTTWQDWQQRHPATTVLSVQTGYTRNYARSPYRAYFQTPKLMFPVNRSNDRLPKKEKVLGILVGDQTRAYPLSSFNEQNTRVEDQLGGKRFVIEFASKANTLRIAEADEGVAWMYSLWFAWYAMHPGTDVYSAD